MQQDACMLSYWYASLRYIVITQHAGVTLAYAGKTYMATFTQRKLFVPFCLKAVCLLAGVCLELEYVTQKSVFER